MQCRINGANKKVFKKYKKHCLIAGKQTRKDITQWNATSKLNKK